MKKLIALLACLFASAVQAQTITGGGGGGAATVVPWTSATTPSVSAGSTTTLPTFTSLVAGYTITGGWNNAGTFPGMLVVNANPNTSSGAASVLLDLQLASVTRFNVDEFGDLTFGTSGGNQFVWDTHNFNGGGTQLSLLQGGGGRLYMSASGITLGATQMYGGAAGLNNANDTGVLRVGAGLWEVNDGTACDASITHCRDVELRSLISKGSVPGVVFAGGTCAGGTITGGATVFRAVTSGVCAAGNTVTITFATTAPHNWNCSASDMTTVADANNMAQITAGESSTVAVFNSGVLASGDTLKFLCFAE